MSKFLKDLWCHITGHGGIESIGIGMHGRCKKCGHIVNLSPWE